MKKMKLLLKISLPVLMLAFFLVSGSDKTAWAQKSSLNYPVKELGYCRDAKECYLFCEIPENKATCWSYGKYKLYSQVLGEEDDAMEAEAKARGITFPIAELGGCASIAVCREYCGKQENYNACSEFAKKKGFSREESPQEQAKKAEMMQNAKTELGCTSTESCRSVCESQPERCAQFAKKYGLAKEESGEQMEKRRKFVETAKSELGCTSEETCRNFCESKENREKCVQFAKKQGFSQSGGEGENKDRKKMPCDSDETCKKYCQENPSECPGFNQQKQQGGGGQGGAYTSPSGCRTEEECRKWCLDNPDKCPGYKQSGDYQQDVMNRQSGSSGSASPASFYRPPTGGEKSGQMNPSLTPAVKNYPQVTPGSGEPAGTIQYPAGSAPSGTNPYPEGTAAPTTTSF